MDKKLTRTDILLSLCFIFTLMVGVGSFFYGFQIGKEQTDQKYQAFMERLKNEQNHQSAAYRQQQLVSFYHTVLVPFRDFQQAWFILLDNTETKGGSEAPKELLTQISRLAGEKYKTIEPSTIPDASPLLKNANTNYLKSLKLFHEAANRLKGRSGILTAREIQQDPYVLEAYSFALEAQRQYYDAILEWDKTTNPNVAMGRTGKDLVTLDEWKHWDLNSKNAYIARMLLADGILYEFNPQDITSRIDDLSAKGQTDKLHLTSIRQALQTLLTTGGVRSGDYLRLKNKLYENEMLPQLPFF